MGTCVAAELVAATLGGAVAPELTALVVSAAVRSA
jgi:hypothetical protein